ncbi:ATP-binding cassette domain-containing protein [Microbacterium sp. P26]|uniref:ABC transporter ATP-binding protein n=1 Tax=Microbacterium TaxID=33882 RepID=UPI00203F5895|nr:ATP-binding cassette domain-containing protein [Microbacterium sp. P26]MCM3501133.1 ATP-binding cassette domain-containing protein [Microbacterium sp. P26]
MSLEIHNEVVAVVGRNGAGKSTLLNAITGLTPLTTGSIRIFGHDPFARSSRRDAMRRVGYLPQEFGFVPSFTVQEFVEYGAWLKGVKRDRVASMVTAALEEVSLLHERHTKMGKLSGGMRRRAGIAHSVVHGPDLLILDEPTAGLDPEQRIRFRELIRLLAPGRAVVMSSHLVEDVQALAARIVVLEAGQIAFSGTVEELETFGELEGAGDSALEKGYIRVLGEAGQR